MVLSEKSGGRKYQPRPQTQLFSLPSPHSSGPQKASPPPRAAFTATLGREPDAAELQHATVFLNNRPADPAASIRDLLWALLTCAEFLTARR